MPVHRNILFHLLALFSGISSAGLIQSPGSPSATFSIGRGVRTIEKRAEPSDYPWATNEDPVIQNEFKWLGWDPNNADDERDGKKIHQAFREWHQIAQAGGNAAIPDSVVYKRWFGTQVTPEDPLNVFKHMIDLASGVASPNVATLINRREDFAKPPYKCPDKPRMAAYMLPNGNFHVCPYGLQRPLASEISCDSLDASVSAKMRSLPLALLHEFTHAEVIGSDAIYEIIIDHKSKAGSCFLLEPEKKLTNAQNYAWLAADAYFSTTCGRTFVDPAPDTDATDDSDDGVIIPDPRPLPPLPPQGPTKKLAIVTDFMTNLNDPRDFRAFNKLQWHYIQTEPGKSVECRTDSAYHEEMVVDRFTDVIFYPKGTFNMRLFDEDCRYENPGDNPGKLFCGDREIECKDDPADAKADKGNYKCGVNSTRQPVFVCEY